MLTKYSESPHPPVLPRHLVLRGAPRRCRMQPRGRDSGPGPGVLPQRPRTGATVSHRLGQSGYCCSPGTAAAATSSARPNAAVFNGRPRGLPRPAAAWSPRPGHDAAPAADGPGLRERPAPPSGRHSREGLAIPRPAPPPGRSAGARATPVNNSQACFPERKPRPREPRTGRGGSQSGRAPPARAPRPALLLPGGLWRWRRSGRGELFSMVLQGYYPPLAEPE